MKILDIVSVPVSATFRKFIFNLELKQAKISNL